MSPPPLAAVQQGQQQGRQQQQGKTPYELEREENIRRRKAQLDACLAGVDTSALQHKPKPAQAKPLKPRAPKPLDAGPKRKSSRTEGKERPKYAEQQALFTVEERPLKMRKLRESKPGVSSSRAGGGDSRFPAWHEGIPVAPFYAQEAALEAAEAAAAAGKKAFAKRLMGSMVSGGFWLQAPRGIHAHLEAEAQITFTCADDTRPAVTFLRTQAARKEGAQRSDAWSVMFIDKKDKAKQPTGCFGFSGNWRGFAADQFLHVGDCVVFAVTDSTSLDVTLFRAWDFAEEEDKPANFEESIRWTPMGATAAAAAGSGDDDAADGDEAAGAAAGSEDGGSEGAAGTAAAPAADGSKKKRGRSSAAAAAAAAGAGGDAAAYVTVVKKARGGGSSGSKPGGGKAAAVAAAGTKKGGSKSKAAAAVECGKQARQRRGSSKPQAQQAKQRVQPANKKQQQQVSKQQQAEAKEDEEEIFTVEAILAKKVVLGVTLYKVRWAGFGSAHDTWEPAESFDQPVSSYPSRVAL